MRGPPASQRWLFGPAPDLLLGCGLGYAALVAALLLAGAERASPLYLALVPLISLLTGTPHYGATLLRAYQSRADRRAYRLFAVHATWALLAAFYLALYDARVGSLLLTLYLTWSPWHYSGQNYGIALLFLRRRGVEVTPLAKRCLYLFYLLSFALTLLALHGAAGGEYAPVQPYAGGVFRLLRLGIPSPFFEAAFALAGVGALAALALAAALLLRRARPADLLPTAALAATQLLWFALPALARFAGYGPFAEGGGQAAYAFFWVATGHSVQYLWITTYYAERAEPASGRGLYLARTLLAGSFVWSAPALLYSRALEGSALGGVAFDGDVFVVLAAAVNLHHFVLDGAIWKLRDGRVARVLIRREEPGPADAPPRAPVRRRIAPLVYAVGGAATLVTLGSWGLRQLGLDPALRRGDLLGAQTSLTWLTRLRYDSAADYLELGRLAASRGELKHAVWSYRRSAERHPRAAPYVALARLELQRREPRAAIEALERALHHNPNDPNALFLLGRTWLQEGEPERALPVLEHAVTVVPDDERVAKALDRARHRSPPP